MDIDEKDSIRAEVSALDIEIAVVDAINTYLREVLEPNGVIDSSGDDAYPDLAGSERNRMKYRIANRAALSCLGKVPDMNFRQDRPWIKKKK